jgi:hypothetical protein
MPQKNKTAPTAADPNDFVGRVDDERKRKDSEELITLMQKVTGEPPRMWGASIIGFGVNKYKYASGREGEICLAGFSPRKPSLVLYLGEVLEDAELMARLGKHKTGKGCLYIKTLDDVDRKVLKELVTKGVAMTRKRMEAK